MGWEPIPGQICGGENISHLILSKKLIVLGLNYSFILCESGFDATRLCFSVIRYRPRVHHFHQFVYKGVGTEQISQGIVMPDKVFIQVILQGDGELAEFIKMSLAQVNQGQVLAFNEIDYGLVPSMFFFVGLGNISARVGKNIKYFLIMLGGKFFDFFNDPFCAEQGTFPVIGSHDL